MLLPRCPTSPTATPLARIVISTTRTSRTAAAEQTVSSISPTVPSLIAILTRCTKLPAAGPPYQATVIGPAAIASAPATSPAAAPNTPTPPASSLISCQLSVDGRPTTITNYELRLTTDNWQP